MPRGGKIGNRGGGRKSAYQEMGDAQELWAMFNDPGQLDALKKRVAAGKHSIRDAMILKALTGSERIISEMFRKLFPDLEKVDHTGTLKIEVVDFEDKK